MDQNLRLILADDENATEVSPDSTIQLQLAPGFLQPVLSQPYVRSGKYGYLGRDVRWWDLNTALNKSKFLKSPELDQEAELLYQEKVLGSKGQKLFVQRTVVEILPKLAWYEKHFRLVDERKVYEDVPVPLDPYFMGVW